MNPNCERELFLNNGDIAEKAHIVPHCNTADDSFKNLILLCPNCHTDFDKNSAFDAEEVKNWKNIRQKQLLKIFAQKFDTFDELEETVKPILYANKTIYENYYLIKENPKLWKKFEEKILINNQKLKLLFNENKKLFQKNQNKDFSNLAVINQLILHIDEFRDTREDDEKIRSVLFPTEINSMFGLKPIDGNMLPSVEALECLIENLQQDDKFIEISLGIEKPYIAYKKEDKFITLFLDDTPKIRQMYFIEYCFKSTGVRLKNLNFALQYLNKNNIQFAIENYKNLTDIVIKDKPFKFIYKYCLSKADLIAFAPQKDLTIINLHNWNSSSCISNEAYIQAEIMSINLWTIDNFFIYIHQV
ncbi:HNH endonuclease [Bathymodiolus thermophilus thioautotrophic gill symbiont]|uniref:HNH endonuclease n=2 Tax=Bathymodiolus thermophilus thioautotrophic gill symbiont TaxID=2360 RepID=A0A1J5TVN3_9GAMM|nr:HNH endonuclease [Bathymodiolus thermophilus thioautotrophic gill symbiont]